jgi:hypothetical protein
MTLKISWPHQAEKLARGWLHEGENSHRMQSDFPEACGFDGTTSSFIRPAAQVRPL